jgi:predicted ATPase
MSVGGWATALLSIAGSAYYVKHQGSDKPAVETMKKVPKTEKRATDSKTKIHKVVLTGGPCGGKSSALSHFTAKLQEHGVDVYTVPEVPTIVMGAGCKYPGLHGPKDKLFRFEKAIVDVQKQLEDSVIDIAESTGKPAVIVYDRGLHDIKAYLPNEIWHEMLKHYNWTEDDFLNRYDLVVHLVTAAHGAEKFYTTSNNAVRKETPEQARELDDKVKQAWLAHKRHKVVDNSTGFQQKLEKTTDAVLQLVTGAK